MQIVAPIDIEDALRIDLTTLYETLEITGVTFSAPPVEPTLGEIPATGVIVCFKRVGGARDDLVVDTHAVSVDLYASTWADAIAEGNRLAGVLTQLPYQATTRIRYQAVDLVTAPYALPDTSNPVMPRVRMLADIITKADVDVLPA
jgi:hypothetical protein